MGDKFTPGPWVVGDPGSSTEYMIYCDNALGTAVATVKFAPLDLTGWSHEERIANARLIAAAPCMGAYVRKRAEAGDDDARALLARIEGGAA